MTPAGPPIPYTPGARAGAPIPVVGARGPLRKDGFENVDSKHYPALSQQDYDKDKTAAGGDSTLVPLGLAVRDKIDAGKGAKHKMDARDKTNATDKIDARDKIDAKHRKRNPALAQQNYNKDKTAAGGDSTLVPLGLAVRDKIDAKIGAKDKIDARDKTNARDKIDAKDKKKAGGDSQQVPPYHTLLGQGLFPPYQEWGQGDLCLEIGEYTYFSQEGTLPYLVFSAGLAESSSTSCTDYSSETVYLAITSKKPAAWHAK